MKKWIVISLFIIVAFILTAYVLLPGSIAMNRSSIINTTRSSLYRLLLSEKSIAQWWPGIIDSTASGKQFILHNRSYKFIDNNIALLPVTITYGREVIHSSLYLIQTDPDHVRLEWTATIPSNSNPFKKVSNYFDSKGISDDMDNIFSKMQSYFSDEKNIYGLNIAHQVIVDSTFIFTEKISSDFPSTEFIYDMIAKLRAYSKKFGVEETNYPILNISLVDSTNYLVKVALPVNKAVPYGGDIESKRMPVNVNILMAEVKGGQHTAGNAFEQLRLYISDHHLHIPGLPFFSLVTDRAKEADTTKWITRVYFPVR